MNKKKANKIDFSKHLFRASSFGNLMAGTKGISDKQLNDIKELQEKSKKIAGLGKIESDIVSKLQKLDSLTDKENIKLSSLIEKRDNIKGLTTKQKDDLDKLIHLRDKPLELSKGAKTYLRKLYRELKWNRRVPLESKFLEKGIELEEGAITMLTIHKGEMFTNNKKRLNNKFFTGEVDVIEGYDTKCSWWLDSFPEKNDPLPSIYYYQNMVYMDLHNSNKWSTVYCLMDMTAHHMLDKFYREEFKPEFKGKELPEWKKMELINLYVYTEKTLFEFVKLFDITFKDDEKAVEIFNNFIEIPFEKRIIEKEVERDDDEIKLMHEIVKLARKELIRLDTE